MSARSIEWCPGGVLRGAATPRIDSIAAEDFQLTNFNVEAECTPSRSALMSGRYGITKWEITLAEMLSNTSYATGIFGQWPRRRAEIVWIHRRLRYQIAPKHTLQKSTH